ncbi:MAG: deoxyguanosinetriphosphate triphosphohydrolase [Chloroflexi bacterium]|nr:deoxyguanosinetriphosphate triphosphohydrolase [Chloroflexota bacterium]
MIFTREQLEEIEKKSLAPYGARSQDSLGREYPSNEPNYRTIFQRDRDRILHTTAFRRLEYKTQVFINYAGDYFRTRLTHTLEVAQIGRTLAKALGANQDLIETICLAHDLGHSPFGHSGEVALNRLMKDHNGFEHNKQSHRIVTKLEKRYPDFPGLNLSWEVREGIVKHETEYDSTDASKYNPELRGQLEAQLANVADELAYTTSDLDDGLRSGMINTGMLKGFELWEEIKEKVGWKDQTLTDLDRHQLIRKLVGMMVSDSVQSISKRLEDAKVQSSLDIQKLDHNEFGFSESMKKSHRELKDFLYNNLYRHHRVIRMQTKAENILEDMFNAYIKEPRMLPGHYKNLIDDRGLERTICDYLAGMTDRYAIEEHKKLFNPETLP